MHTLFLCTDKVYSGKNDCIHILGYGISKHQGGFVYMYYKYIQYKCTFVYAYEYI